MVRDWSFGVRGTPNSNVERAACGILIARSSLLIAHCSIECRRSDKSNDRFLIFPWVEVPNLASHALSLATRQIGDDWVHAFGYRPVLIETFVDPTFFSGTCYRAANWQFLGHSQGRGRLAPDQPPRLSKKEPSG